MTNKKYTNKDFQAIYGELLDLVEELTTKWSPSNEADPGVVLIKLMAVLGDKLNYNIDRQVLELFPNTVTQRKNARQIYNLIGYKMSWYNSATIQLGFKKKEQHDYDIIIPKYTVLTNSDEDITYITLEQIELEGGADFDSRAVTYVKAIEGTLNNDILDISVSELDDNNRIYFNKMNIAENGIFVSEGGTNLHDWTRVDNIDSYTAGNKVFEFNVNENEDNCYIEFPSDVATTLIGDTIRVRYITSSGEEGNILKETLTKFSTPVFDTESEEMASKVGIVQSIPSTSGRDPETVDEAYLNSRKTIGTFDTLITKLDYFNYITSLSDNDGIKFVSNAVVSDRDDDINETTSVYKYKGVTEVLEQDSGVLTPYDMVLYMLDNANTYEDNFNPVHETEKLADLVDMVGETKAINLNFLLPSVSGVNAFYLFKAKYTLEGTIITNEKVTTEEAKEIESAVIEGIKSTYSSDKVRFGENIDYNELVDNIVSFDSRIKTASVESRDYTVYKVTVDSPGDSSTIQEVKLTDDDKELILTKLIASGAVSYYSFDDRFKNEIQKLNNITSKILTVEPKFDCTLERNVERILGKNEHISLYVPEYSLTKTYRYGVKVKYETVEDITLDVLDPDTYYKVGGDPEGEEVYLESLTIKYTDSQGQVIDTVANGTVIKVTQGDIEEGVETELNYSSELKLYSLNEVTLDNNFYITGTNLKEEVTLGEEESYVLGQGEWLTYTDQTTSGIVALQEGFIIKNIDSASYTFKKQMEDGEQAEINNLQIINQKLKNLSEGCKIKLIHSDTNIELNESNDRKATLANSQKLEITDGTGTTTIDKNIAGDYYTIISTLNINYYGTPVELQSGHILAYTAVDPEDSESEIPGTIDSGLIEFNRDSLSLLGRRINSFESDYATINIEDLYINKFEIVENPVEFTNGFYEIGASAADVSFSYNFRQGESYLISLYIEHDSEAVVENGLTLSVDDSSVATGLTKGNHSIKIDMGETDNDSNILVTNGDAAIVRLNFLDITKLDKTSDTDGINREGMGIEGGMNTGNIISNLEALDYNFAHRPKNSEFINEPLKPINWFNNNHVGNKFIIPQFDYEDEDKKIKVSSYSIKE